MATAAQRAISILDALLNTTSTVSQRQRVVAAFGSPENYVREVFDLTKNRVKQFENLSARETTDQAVETDFTPAP